MPRRKPRPDYRSTFWEQPLSLGKFARQELSEILGVDQCREAREAMLKEVADILSEYEGKVEVMNHFPRPANIIAALQTVQSRTDKLSASLDDLDDASRSKLTLRGIGAGALGAELTRLSDGIEVITRELGARESRGADRNCALNDTIRGLVDVYDKHTADWPRERFGREQLRKDFVRTALWAAGIKYPESDISKNLVRRFSKK